MKKILKNFILQPELSELLNNYTGKIIIPKNREHLLRLSMGNNEYNMTFDVCFDIEDKGQVREAYVTKCKNGLVINYDDPYMRRRDPETTVIADDLPTDKDTYEQRYNTTFNETRQKTFNWLFSRSELIIMPFMSGNEKHNLGYQSLLILPSNAAFFALTLADIQGFIKQDDIPKDFNPKAVVFVAPPFRHTHFDGKQVVVHNRIEDVHEVFSYNLYPGPSAKKGIYGVLLNIGERENWITLHASTVSCITPYEQVFTIMHEGASGGGKSEMLEQFHREPNGKLLLGVNTVTNEKYYLSITDSCTLNPITDDMAQVHSSLLNGKKLMTVDAENGWFLRVNHITHYGTEPETEKRTIHTKKPLLFFNMDAKAGATCLIWEPIMDGNAPCPNPRVIMPRELLPGHIDEPVEVDVRSFGLRAPVCTAKKPSYGIAGIFHVLPPALAWLWRLVAPRGDNNPSIVSKGVGLESEGVGSYWPFATGKYVTQANLLLEQIINTPSTGYVLIPNAHIGAYKVGFAGQWVAREYLSRRGGIRFRANSPLVPSRCPLLGYALDSMKVDAVTISKGFLQTNFQREIGNSGYDKGAKILNEFFKKELQKFLTPELNPLGQKIIEACLNDAKVEDYVNLIPR